MKESRLWAARRHGAKLARPFSSPATSGFMTGKMDAAIKDKARECMAKLIGGETGAVEAECQRLAPDRLARVPLRSGRIEARTGLRMMPTVGIEIERAPL
jgi:hypothetical protein